jgi:hypothetical protein
MRPLLELAGCIALILTIVLAISWETVRQR